MIQGNIAVKLTLGNGLSFTFEQIFEAYYTEMCVFGSCYVPKDQAEDLVEDIFVKLLLNPVKFENTKHLKGYLFRAVYHSSLDYLKIAKRMLNRHDVYVTKQQAGDDETTYLNNIVKTEALHTLYSALNKLPEQMSKIMHLAYLENKSNIEIADELGITVNTVKTHKQRALTKLRELISKDQFDILLTAIYLIFKQ